MHNANDYHRSSQGYCLEVVCAISHPNCLTVQNLMRWGSNLNLVWKMTQGVTSTGRRTLAESSLLFPFFPPHTILRPSGPDVNVGRFGPAPALPSAAETAWSTTPICHTSIFASHAQQISTRTPRVSFGLIFIRWYLNGQCQSRLAMATAKGSQKIWDLRWPSSHVLWNGSRVMGSGEMSVYQSYSKFTTCMFIYDTYLIVIVDLNFSILLSLSFRDHCSTNWDELNAFMNHPRHVFLTCPVKGQKQLPSLVSCAATQLWAVSSTQSSRFCMTPRVSIFTKLGAQSRTTSKLQAASRRKIDYAGTNMS